MKQSKTQADSSTAAGVGAGAGPTPQRRGQTGIGAREESGEDASRRRPAKRGRGPRTAPQLPHERDESNDPEGASRPHPDPVGQRASEDVARGLVDTDRGTPMDATYRRLRR